MMTFVGMVTCAWVVLHGNNVALQCPYQPLQHWRPPIHRSIFPDAHVGGVSLHELNRMELEHAAHAELPCSKSEPRSWPSISWWAGTPVPGCPELVKPAMLVPVCTLAGLGRPGATLAGQSSHSRTPPSPDHLPTLP